MTEENSIRVMWLSGHTTTREFEIQMLKKIGVNKLFTPRIFTKHNFQYTDDNLGIPDGDINLIDEFNWIGEVSPSVWGIVNKYFDVIFFHPESREILDGISKYFKGIAIWRTLGCTEGEKYDDILDGNISPNGYGGVCLRRMGRRFFFGESYAFLSDTAPEYLRDRKAYLPISIPGPVSDDSWMGTSSRVYFVCPDILSSSLERESYKEFKNEFKNIPYVVSGGQPVADNDEHQLGFVTNEEHAYNLIKNKVMFYNSQGSNRIHTHPFEAISVGMPLIFMAGSVLDRIGGMDLPGRCTTLAEAKRKIERILQGEKSLIENILKTQKSLLSLFLPKNCESAWLASWKDIISRLDAVRTEQSVRPRDKKRKKLAIILPVGYRGGSLRGAQALAQTLYLGSKQCGEDADIVFLHLDEPSTYSDSDFSELPKSIKRRPYKWKYLTALEASRAMRYAGYMEWVPTSPYYMVPDDGIRHLQDCDVWLIVSHRLLYPILPVKPVVLMVYDFLQRYIDVISQQNESAFISVARAAEKILVTTEFTRQDALQYAGLEKNKVSKVPMLAPDFPIDRSTSQSSNDESPYFIWTTNSTPHKNHKNSLEALRIYYEELDGQLNCKVTGVDTKNILTSNSLGIEHIAREFKENRIIKRKVKWMGDLSDKIYQNTLSKAQFIWHAGKIDNGTFSVIEAACLNVPALSSDYPAMREIDHQFSLNMTWMDPNSPRHMANQLKFMENNAAICKDSLPSESKLQAQRFDNYAKEYWQEVRSCL